GDFHVTGVQTCALPIFIIVISSSSRNFRQTHHAKYHTTSTTIDACTRPSEPDSSMSEKIIRVPSRTRPIFTNNSVVSIERNHSGSRKRLPIRSPIDKLKITASKLKSRTDLM